MGERSQNVLALLFTDAQGMVIFADDHFLRLFNYAEAGMVVGEPLHLVLKTNSQTTTQLLRSIAQTGYVHDLPIEVQSGGDATMHLLCTGVATYDDHNSFIGADITLRSLASAAPIDHPLTHEDSLSTHIQQVQAKAESLESESLLEVYVTAQLGALDILLARLGGPRVRKTLSGVANKKAEQLGLLLRMADGNIQVDCRETEHPSAACAALLQEAVHYAASVIGRRMVLAEMQAVDGQMDARTRSVADQAGLRKILNGR